VPSFWGLSIINRITPFLKIYKYEFNPDGKTYRQNRQKTPKIQEFFGYFYFSSLKKGQKSPILKAIIMQYNIIT